MNEKAATIVSAIEHATRHMRTKAGQYEAPPLDPKKSWDAHCSAMFRETMRQLALRGALPKGNPNWHLYIDENATANDLGRSIRHKKEDWFPVALDRAQHFANGGALIVGSYVNAQGSGHIGFVYPVEVHRGEPLIRDGNIHRDKQGAVSASSSYGAVPASKAFPLKDTFWFQYRHY